jgi:hypothetical protein
MDQELIDKLNQYKRKYYLSKLIRGILLVLSVSLVLMIVLLLLEYYLQLDAFWRTTLVLSSLSGIFILFFWWVIREILAYLQVRKGITDAQAAVEIGRFYPEIKDKLLNTLQLKELSEQHASLIKASLEQKSRELRPFTFSRAIDLKLNLKYVKVLVVPIMISVGLYGVIPSLYSESGDRIVNFQTEYIPTAPFQFVYNESARAFRNEDVNIEVKITGESIPNSVYLEIDDRLVKMQPLDNQLFIYKISSIQKNLSFQFYAAGFRSSTYDLAVYDRPDLVDFNLSLEYPPYTRVQSKVLDNIGSIVVPEGTYVSWNLSTYKTDSAIIVFENKSEIQQLKGTAPQFFLRKQIKESSEYTFHLFNEFSQNENDLSYEIEIIRDQLPDISVDFFPDTLLFDYVILSGDISDDYGFSSLVAHLKVDDVKTVLPIGINNLQNDQSFYYRIDLDSLDFDSTKELTVFAEISDNDAINGFKKRRSELFTLKIPDRSDIRSSLTSKSRDAEKKIDESIKEAETLNDKLSELEERLRLKNKMEWQEEKLLNEILEQRKDLNEQLDKLKKEYEELRNTENKFSERSDRIKEKAQKLQELMNQVLDEETKKMYEELERLLNEQKGLEDIQDQINRIRPNEANMEEELERALELFKRLKLESELERSSEELKELGEEQEKLGEKTSSEEKSVDESLDSQEEIEKRFDDLMEQLDEIEQLNQELKTPEPLENTTNEEESINETFEDIKNELERNNREKGSQKQRESGEKMKELGQKLETMQANMEMEMIEANIDDLRNILDDLVKVSFEQEQLITDFRSVRQIDPRFVELSQEQLKLKNDTRIIKDSLLALAERVVQISSFITREVSEVDRNMDAAMEELKSRNRSKALSNQQFAMTSINNLALLLDDVLQQMQMSMAEAMGKSKKNQQGNQKLPNLKELQQQLSERINDLKDSGLKGRKLSEELAKMAAEQELLRNELQKLQEEIGGQLNPNAKDNLGKAIEEMENNEIDLVNKRLTQELFNRQEEIMTRLLEAEDALREQELDEEREGVSADDYEKQLPEAFEEYLKEREKEIELLKSVPVELIPFYKKELNDYFRRLSSPNPK